MRIPHYTHRKSHRRETQKVHRATRDWNRRLAVESLESRRVLNGDFGFAVSYVGDGDGQGEAVVTDAAGSVYATGLFYGTIDFDPGPGTFNLTSAGSSDAYVTKSDSAGNLIWAKSFGGSGSDNGKGIGLDAAGNVYTVGSFFDTVDFDPGAGTFNLTSAGFHDAFVHKLDTDGNFEWAVPLGGESRDFGYAIDVDAAGNIHTTGQYSRTVDFDPGPGTANLTSAGRNDYNVFVSKLDSGGNYVWARSMGGESDSAGLGIAVGPSGEVYTTGQFVGSADLDPGAGDATFTSQGLNDIFISKLDSAGDYQWAQAIGGTSNDQGKGLAVDAAGNVYATGYYYETVDFDPGPATVNYTSEGLDDIYVTKFDGAGDLIWARSMGGADNQRPAGIAVDSVGDVYTTGEFYATVDFDPGSGTANLSSAGGRDVFVSKLDSAGDYVWARSLGGTSQDNGYGIAVDISGRVYSTGYFNQTADFDPGPGTFNLNSPNGQGVFLSQLTQVVSPVYDFTAASFTDVEGDGVNTSSTIMLSRSDSSSAESVDVILTDTSATSAVDFTAGPVTVHFEVGEVSQVVPIEILGDMTVEADESVELSLGGFTATGSAGTTQPTATWTIENDDSASVTFEGDVAVIEGSGPSPTKDVTFFITLDNPVEGGFNLSYSVIDGTATAADDFELVSANPITFAGLANELRTITVRVTEDTDVEDDEFYQLALGALSNLAAGIDVNAITIGSPVTGTIINDDIANTPATADIGGPYAGDEGSSITLDASASTDPDQDPNTLTYEWDLDGDGEFDDATGVTTSFSLVDGPESLPVSVRVTDNEGESDVAAAVVTVKNVDPTALDATFQLVENSAYDTSVGTVTASDPASVHDPLTFEIVGGTGDTAFEIDSASGEITVADPQQLDFETTPSFTLEVEVTDGDGGSDTATITIDLINQASISGVVFVDVNENGQYDANEPGIDGVTVELRDENGDPVLDEYDQAITAVTSDGGFYLFEDLDPADYQLHELQPTGVSDGAELLGSLGGTLVSNDTMQLTLAHEDAFDYAFAEVGQQVASGDTGTIGFWQNKHGQALIAAGGTDLANWLTTNFGNVFGSSLDGADGQGVASFYRDQLFRQKGKKSAGPAKVDAQFMAVALATYFTSSNLAGTLAGSYGFNVTDTGIGTRVANVGTSGAAFDVADGTDLTIMQLLLATNALTDQPDAIDGFSYIYDTNGDGEIDAAEAALRALANEVFSGINEGGDI